MYHLVVNIKDVGVIERQDMRPSYQLQINMAIHWSVIGILDQTTDTVSRMIVSGLVLTGWF